VEGGWKWGPGRIWIGCEWGALGLMLQRGKEDNKKLQSVRVGVQRGGVGLKHIAGIKVGI